MNFKYYLIAISSIVFMSPVNAELSPQEYAKCSSMKGDLARLDCFDRLAKSKKLDSPQLQKTTLKDKGKWLVNVEKNPVDDSKTVNLYLDADSGESSYGKGVFLVVRCKSNKTELYINWNDYLGGEAYVLTRIGNEKAKTRQWSLSTDSKSTFHGNGTISFLKKMMASDKFLAQVTPYNENPVTAIFNTRGMAVAIKPLRQTCHWTKKKDGLYTVWDKNGQKKTEGYYKNEKQDGVKKEWHYNGQKKRESNYKNGKKDGLETFWNINGVKKYSKNYENGLLNGISTNWHDNGQKITETTYKNGKKHGRLTRWSKNGAKGAEFEYNNGYIF